MEEIILNSDGKATGIKVLNTRGTRKGKVDSIYASDAVISNVDMHAMRSMIPLGKHIKFDEKFEEAIEKTPLLNSFIHLHAGIDAEDLPTICEELPGQWAYMKSWDLPGKSSPLSSSL